MSVKELVQDLESLSEAQLQEVATYVSFLKYRAYRTGASLLLDATELAALYGEFAEEDRQLAENQWGPGIEKTPGVMGGDACIAHTRIPVWLLESYRRLGWSEAEILENFPTLRAANLVQAWAYGVAHREEIEQALREQEEA